MRIIRNPDGETAKKIKKALRENGGYCPCKLTRSEETKCICREFYEGGKGMCHCGLYIKIEE